VGFQPAKIVPTSAARTKPRSIRRFARSLAADAARLRERLQGRISVGDKHVQAAVDSLAADLGRDVSVEEAADVLAQAVTCAGAIVATQPQEWKSARQWLHAQASVWERVVVEELSTECSVLGTQYPANPPSVAHLYEHFLHAFHPTTRKRGGVFFTPEPIADYVVRQVDERLRDDFGLPLGLATQSAFRNPQSAISLLDPACGTGVFLLAVIDRLHRQLAHAWNAFVPAFLPQLIGVEILPPAALLAKLNIALKLAETGYEFRGRDKIQIRIGDALDPKLQFAIRNSQFAIPVIVGNPPFSSLSTNTNDWIARLVRGDDEVRGYVRANGQLLGERKTWLHDDYVKFIRLAQWHVEEAGRGIVGLVTNRGYLDNATFRLMRQELLRAFPQIQIVDLHGSHKNGRRSPAGAADENVFGLAQGVAIGILARSASEGQRRVEYRELWGSRVGKLQRLAQNESVDLTGLPSLALQATMFAPAPPEWKFVPRRAASHPEYDAGWLLTELMPASTPAPVTARDHFVVGFTADELQERIEAFRDLSIPDDAIRRRYFTRTRSARYQPGDTRGWKLAAARRIVAADAEWTRHIVRCLYRPFDWRYVFWHPAMIDWPRSEVTRHLLAPIQSPKSKIQNLCLLARRQQLPTQPCTFFWISDGLALDGVIRSDNRGSESLFPLYLVDDPHGQLVYQANFNPQRVAQLAGMLGLAWLPLGRGDLAGTFGPEDLLGYLYALFHSPGYRQRYAEELRTDFPRVLPPASREQFARWSTLGRELIELHLLRAVGNDLGGVPQVASAAEYYGGRSLQEVQQFRVGGYVALTKWLQPKHRSTREAQYDRIAAAIARTIKIMAQLDADA
jgi:predicted helicase